jgi:hypothetical protein
MDHLFLNELVKNDAISNHALLKTDEVPLHKRYQDYKIIFFFFFLF